MKTLNVLSLLILVMTSLASNLVLAAHEDSLQIFPQLKRSKKVISGFADFLVSAQSEVVLSEESYIQNSINNESALLNQLTAADVQASGPECLDFIRTSTNLLVNLAGISYTNCFNDVDTRMFEELSRFPELALTREAYDQFSLLGVFRGENIFIDPIKIRDKLLARLGARVSMPTLNPETEATLRAVLGGLKTNFLACMNSSQTKLADNLQYTSEQVRAICAAEATKHI
ncbi:uncharacterized protein LOC129727464 [Wyeomyia smithii]|uniref:uncharacterized protein LOC129727464 n=1 Tax=Wyeomyia smithii TaxID=174621 RepID=UPI002467C3EC|nr:uncharacterized protein LOC129727464 [Wyeomyia smithii]